MNEKELELMRQQAMEAAFTVTGDGPDPFDETNPDNVKYWEVMAKAQSDAWKAQKEQWKQELEGIRPQKREPMTPEKWEADLKRQQADVMAAAKSADSSIRQSLIEQGFDPDEVMAAAGGLIFEEGPVYQPFEPVVTQNAEEAGLSDLPPTDEFGRPLPQVAADIPATAKAVARKLGRKANSLKDDLKELAPVLALVGIAAFVGAFLGAKAAKRR